MAKTIIISLGGSLIIPDSINTIFLKKFRSLILSYASLGNRVIIICGGGRTSRLYQHAVGLINPKVLVSDVDWVGIGATRINAELVRAMFGDRAYETVLHNPTKKIQTNKKIIIGSGFVPGSSSDKDAVLIAKAYGATTVINLSNISYVYDKDPKRFSGAKAFATLSWSQMIKITGTKWTPGANFPFDPVACALAKRYGLRLIVMNGKNLKQLKNFLAGRRFTGTIVV